MKSFVAFIRNYFLLYILLCMGSSIVPIVLQAQFSISTTTTLPGVLSASVAWGDYDNDNDLDILLTGQDGLGTAIGQVYKNTGGGVFTTAATLIGVSNGSVAWGDYDNDGDIDILLTGMNNSSSPVSRVYRNDGGDTFTSVVTLTGVYNSSAAWGDYDNDGDLDILLAGQTGLTSGIAGIYRNNGDDTFTQTVSLVAVYNGAAAAWGDYDNDGRLDVIIAGQTGLVSGVARIYHNNGNDNFSATIDLPNLALGLSQAAAVWGDYDNDGDIDLLVSGNNLLGLVSISTIYRNDGNNTFTSAVSLLGLLSGSAAWGDYDNDGDLDILQTGLSLGVGVSRVYRNDGNNNFAVAATLTGLFMSSVAWGDHDNDGDLDILLAGDTGLNPVTALYNNTILTANTAPSAPGNLQVVLTSETSATLSWSRASDAETAQNGMSYAVSVGTTVGGVQIKSGHANVTTGFRRIPEIGNVFETTATVLTGLVPGQTYHYSVQAIDAGLRGSTFASGSFITPITTATQLVVTNMSSTTPLSGSSVTMTIEVQNSFGDAVPVTQATTLGVSLNTPYLTISGSTQATVQAGESGTTLTLTINSTSSASVTTLLTVSTPGLTATSQSVTITPSDLYIASHLVVTGMTPPTPESGEPFTVTVEAQNSFGDAVPVTQATTLGVSLNTPYLTISGSTQATVQAGESGTTLTLTINSTSSASVTTLLTVSTPGLTATSQSVTITPSDLYIASHLVVTGMTPPTPESGEPFTVTVEAQNSFGDAVPVTQATTLGVSLNTPYLTISGSTQATVQAGESGTTLTLTINSTSSASVTTLLTVSTPGLTATSQSVTITPSDLYIASHLVVTGMTPPTPESGEPFTVTVEAQNSFGDAVPVTQATTLGVSLNTPYLTISGSTQATVQAGESGTTLTLTINSTSSASVTALLTVSTPGLTATSQSVTITPSDLYIASHLVVTGMTPPTPESGEPFTVTVEAQNSFGDAVPVTQATTLGVSLNTPYLTISGSTQATVQAGESGTTLTLTINSTSSASVTALLTVSTPGLTATSQSVTITPVLSFVASQLAITSITPATPSSGETFVVTIEVQNEFGQAVPATQATVANVLFNNPYLTLAAGSTQAIVQAGQSGTAIMLRLDNSSTSSITIPVYIAADGLSVTSQNVTISGNNEPSISIMIDVTTDEDTPVSSSFTISDVEMPVSELMVTVTSDNTLLLPDTNILISSTAASMTVLLSPALNQSGTAHITLTVSDGIMIATTTFSLTVSPINDSPQVFDDTDTVCANTGSMIMPVANDIDMDGDTLFISSVNQGSYGAVQIMNDSTVQYTPNPGYSGNDSFSYTVSDTHGGVTTAVVHLNIRVPVTASAGADTSIFVGNSVQLQATGGVTYSWLPVTGLSNPTIANPVASPVQTTAYVVTVTDPNGCQARDTVVVVVRGRDLNLTLILGGAYDASTGEMSTLLSMQDFLPSAQPYTIAPFFYSGSENAQTMPADVVDWLLIELRSSMSSSSVVGRQAVLLREDGTLLDAQGYTPTIPDSIPAGDYYVVVYHRNHLAVISASTATLTESGLSYNFVAGSSQAYRDFYDPMVQISPGVYGMISGDASLDTIINAVDRATVRNGAGEMGYLQVDLNLDGIVNAADRVIVRNNSFAVSQVPQ